MHVDMCIILFYSLYFHKNVFIQCRICIFLLIWSFFISLVITMKHIFDDIFVANKVF